MLADSGSLIISIGYILAAAIAAYASIFVARQVGRKNGKGNVFQMLDTMHKTINTHVRDDRVMFRLILQRQGLPMEQIETMLALGQLAEPTEEETEAGKEIAS